MSDTAITKQQQAPIAPMDSMQMIQVAFNKAIEQGAGLEVVDRILDQQAKMMDRQDREAFDASLRRIQDELKPIAKRGHNSSTNSDYATSQSIDDALEGLLQRERMTLSFEPEPNAQQNMVTIVGVLSLGAYSKRYPLPMPCDGQGAKGGGVMTRTHATGSAITYAKRYLKNMIFNLRFKESDDDGNGAGSTGQTMDPGALREWMDKIGISQNGRELTASYIGALAVAAKLGDTSAAAQIEQAANRRKKEM